MLSVLMFKLLNKYYNNLLLHCDVCRGLTRDGLKKNIQNRSNRGRHRVGDVTTAAQF